MAKCALRQTRMWEDGARAARRREFVTALRVLRFVDTRRCALGAQAYADRVLEYQGENESHDSGVGENAERANRLTPQLIPTSAVEQTLDGSGGFGCGEQTDQQRAGQTADEVHADDVERVVEAQLEFQADRQGAQASADRTDHQGAEYVDRRAGRGDGDQSCHDARGGAQRGGVAVADALGGQPGQHRGGGGDGGGDEGRRGDTVGAG